jgi:hypothetical protein
MPSVYPLQSLHLAIKVWVDPRQNLAKPCKLFILCSLTDFVLPCCPILHICLIFRILPLFRASLSWCEQERHAYQQAENARNAHQPQSSFFRRPSRGPQNSFFDASLMKLYGLPYPRSFGRGAKVQLRMEEARMTFNTIIWQPFLFGSNRRSFEALWL